MIILIIITIILILIIIILRRLCSFHCNCFVCSMLDLIYSSSILIDSCRCLPGQKKKEFMIFYFFFSSLVEKIICFLTNEEILRKTFRFPMVLSWKEGGAWPLGNSQNSRYFALSLQGGIIDVYARFACKCQFHRASGRMVHNDQQLPCLLWADGYVHRFTLAKMVYKLNKGDVEQLVQLLCHYGWLYLPHYSVKMFCMWTITTVFCLFACLFFHFKNNSLLLWNVPPIPEYFSSSITEWQCSVGRLIVS